MNSLKIWSLFGVFLLFYSCTNDNSEATVDQLTGYWAMESAMRNGKPINTLENVYFEFDVEGNLTSNLPLSRSLEEYTVLYEVEENTISYSIDDTDYILQIEQLTDSLIVSTQLQSTPFQMVLVRQAQSESGE
ncbi:MAG: hypothetical protein AAF502_13345 [Bacteroidota bacterium]